MSDDPVTETRKPRSFAGFLKNQRRGELEKELSEAIAGLVSDVRAQGKAGKLTLTIGIKPLPKVQGAFTVSDDIKVAAPARPRGESIFYAEEDGTLTRDDPRQRRLPGVARTEDEAAEAVEQLKGSLAEAGVTSVTVTGPDGASTTVNPASGEVLEETPADGPGLRTVPGVAQTA